MPSRTQSYRKIGHREPRRNKRLANPVFAVHINGEVWYTENWSLGGLFLIRSYTGSLNPGDSVDGLIVGTTRNGSESVRFTARVVRRAHRGRALALQFDQLDDRLLDFFERCLRKRLRPSGSSNLK
ncbi:PilZ domain-containing protein [Rhodospirillaceae bacterium SYSU D60014]|uniref:PilZ domain-containing protein n=1 Tax=Virgifigura deserti TaxID=2268457 RepID=UPI000E6713F6